MLPAAQPVFRRNGLRRCLHSAQPDLPLCRLAGRAQAAHRRRIQAFAADRHVRPVLCGHVRRRDVVVEGIGCLGSFLVGLPDLLGGPPRNSSVPQLALLLYNGL